MKGSAGLKSWESINPEQPDSDFIPANLMESKTRTKNGAYHDQTR